MAHYSIEMQGAAPVDWIMLRKQRDRLTGILLDNEELAEEANMEDYEAVRGVRNLLDAMLDTHDREAANRERYPHSYDAPL